MVFWRVVRPAAAGALFLIGTAASPQHDATALKALGAIERGQWQLREEGAATRKLCLSNPAALLQLQHGNAQCEHFVVENSQRVATIHYTCPGHGYGRTTVSVETSRLVHVDTQGVLDGAPFANDLEGRKIGDCG
ncbi:MAG: hypothetical protein WDN44_14985 [Sphingomonas sp.]